jgi:hypothetical protein
LVLASPELMAAAFEKEERRLDKAEAILDRELNSDDPRYSAAAAFFVLRNAKRAVARGWRQPDVEVTVADSGPPRLVDVVWADGQKVATMSLPAGTRIPRPPEIEHSSSEVATEQAPTDAMAIDKASTE